MAIKKGEPPEPAHQRAAPGIQKYVRKKLLASYCRATQDFFLHLFVSMMWHFRHDPQGAVPISKSYIRKYFRYMLNRKELKALEAAGLMIAFGHDDVRKLSKRYYIPQDQLNFMYLVLHDDVQDLIAHPELLSKKRKPRSKVKTVEQVKSDLVKKALKSIDLGLMNQGALMDLFNQRFKAIKENLNVVKHVHKSINDYFRTPEFSPC